MGKLVYVVDAWNDTTQASVIKVFTTREKAERALERIMNRPGKWYAGVVKRTVRIVLSRSATLQYPHPLIRLQP